MYVYLWIYLYKSVDHISLEECGRRFIIVERNRLSLKCMQIGRSSPGLCWFTMCCVVADMICVLDLWIEDELISVINLSYKHISIFILTFDYLRQHVQLLYFAHIRRELGRRQGERCLCGSSHEAGQKLPEFSDVCMSNNWWHVQDFVSTSEYGVRFVSLRLYDKQARWQIKSSVVKQACQVAE